MRKFDLAAFMFLMFLRSLSGAAEMRDLHDLNQLKKVFEENKANVRILSLLSPT